MDIWDKIESCKHTLTPRELEIYELFKKDPYTFSAGTAMEIASRYGVAQSAISRFCQKLGFSGFADFRLSMTLGLSANLQKMNGLSKPEDTQDCASTICHIVNLTNEAMSDSVLDDLSRRILQSTNVYTSGYGASLCNAQILAFLLTISSIPAHVMLSSQELETLHVIKNTDTVFLFSVSNPSHRDFLSLVTDLPPEKRPYTVLVTSIPKHPLRRQVSQVVMLPSWASWSTAAFPVMMNNLIPQFTFSQLIIDRVKRLYTEI